MTLGSLIVAILVPIISGLVAIFIANYTVKKTIASENKRQNLSRQQTISEFRQAWINSLRDALAEFLSYGMSFSEDPNTARKMHELGIKIELLMNPADEDYRELQLYLKDILGPSGQAMLTSKSPVAQIPDFKSRLISLCQKILKREWDKLKAEMNNPNQFIKNEQASE